MSNTSAMSGGRYYHVYNRGNNGEILFRGERNYRCFLQLYFHDTASFSDTFAWCLMPNHFHFLIYTHRQPAELPTSKNWQVYIQNSCRTLFSTYTKAFNKAWDRTGSLFEKPFHRKEIKNPRYLQNVACCIHPNPVKHGIGQKLNEWPGSLEELAQIHLNPSHDHTTAMKVWYL